MEPRSETIETLERLASLDVVQRWFSAVVTHPDGVEAGVESDQAQALSPMTRDELERVITRTAKMSASERLSIYANAYYARLIECLGDSFPVLKCALGEEVFNGFAFGYLQSYPSRSYTLSRLGDHFAKYLEETRPDREEERDAGWPDFLIDLARLEWTIEQVFDGPGIEGKQTLKSADLLDIPQDRWREIRLRSVPCLRLLRFRFPVIGYYSAVRACKKDDQINPPGPADSYAAITRRDYLVRLHELSEEQYALLERLDKGEPLGKAIEGALESADFGEERSAEALRDWFSKWSRLQFFESVELV